MKHRILLTSPDVRDVIESGSALENSSLSTFGNTVDDIGGGTYHLLYKFGVYAVVISIMVAGFFILWSNSQNRGEAKNSLVAKLFGGFLIFAAIAIAAILQKTGMGFFAE